MQSFLKAKADKPLPVSPRPFLHSRQSTSKILWETIAATFPVILLSLFFFGWNALRIYSIAVSFGLLFEYLFQLVSSQKSRIHDGSTVLISILLSWLMPPNASFVFIIFSVFVAVVLAKELFGGIGQNLFQPVLAGYASALALFPKPMMVPDSTFHFSNFFWWKASPIIGTGSAFLVLICGSFLLAKKFIRFENSVFYLLSSLAGFYVMALDVQIGQLIPFLILVSFFIITDSASGPMTKEGRILFSTTAGVLTAAFVTWMNIAQAAAAAILITNTAVPLIDHFVYSVIKHETA